MRNKLAVIIILLLLISNGRARPAYTEHDASFIIKIKDIETASLITSVFAMPAEKIKLKVVDNNPLNIYQVTDLSKRGVFKRTGKYTWDIRAPEEKGLYRLAVSNTWTGSRIELNLFVMVPSKQIKNGILNGYKIGNYPAVGYKGLTAYQKIPGFIEVTKENENTYISPHFQLKQFLCKQPSQYPKYIALKERLPLKLELVLAELKREGYLAETLHIMSGYRTPFYNQALGNVKYSRHIYGDAADIFIDDNPEDGSMDDLNNDNVVDHRDAMVLFQAIEQVESRKWNAPYIGGLGRYTRNKFHGPFVHVDTRGFFARWGVPETELAVMPKDLTNSVASIQE
ncbi:MAG: D-Ala-D-Ala carboxypeptidase family metallohydrolase [Candidatus Margulisiibacteriota bacterium]